MLKMEKRTPSDSSSSSAKVHIVAVGEGNFMYNPNNITADVGDIVSFQFYPTNHSVIQGFYCGDMEGGCNPCIPINLIDNDIDGFASQNYLTEQDANPQDLTFQTYNLTIKDTKPIWFYCSAIGSCNGHGMVGVINAANNTSIERQMAVAQSAPYQLSPGQSLPGSSPMHHSSLSAGAIAGIAIAAALLIVFFCFTSYRFIRRRRIRRAQTLGHPGHQSFQISDVRGSQIPPIKRTTLNLSATHGNPQWSPYSQISPNRVDPVFEGQQTQYPYYVTMDPRSTPQPPGTFIGYNRHTGAAEFAQEVPSGIETTVSPKTSPWMGGGDGEFNWSSQIYNTIYNSQNRPEVRHELPGEHPKPSEVGP